MFRVSFRNVPKDRILLKQLRFATQVFANFLFSKRLQNHLNILIIFDEKIKPCLGYVNPWLNYENSRFRDFEVVIREKMSQYEILRILAHEMKHIQQYAEGHLYQYEKAEDRFRWKRRTYICEGDTFSDRDKPWEIEAYAAEDILIDHLQAYLDTLPNKKGALAKALKTL